MFISLWQSVYEQIEIFPHNLRQNTVRITESCLRLVGISRIPVVLCPPQNRSKLIKFLYISKSGDYITSLDILHQYLMGSSWDFFFPNIYLESPTMQLAPIASHPITVCPQEDSNSVIL